MMNSLGQPVPFDPTYFTIKMQEITSYGHGSSRITNTTDLGMYDCSKEFPILHDLHNTFNLNGSLIWPRNKGFRLSGNYYSDTSSIFSIKLYRWSGSSLCHTSVEINDKIKDTVINIAINDWYVNFDDFNNPIKSFINDHFTYQLVSGFNKQLKLYVKQSKIELNDNYVLIENTQNIHFLDVERSSMDIVLESSDGEIFDVSVKLEGNQDIYKRTVFSLFDLMGQVGGTYQVLFIICGYFFVKLLSTEMLLSSVFRRLYLTNVSESKQSYTTQISEILSRIPRSNKIEELKSPNDKSEWQINMSSHNDFSRLSSDINLSVLNSQNTNMISEDQSISITNQLKNILSTRRKYKASGCHKILTLLPICVWRSSSFIRK